LPIVAGGGIAGHVGALIVGKEHFGVGVGLLHDDVFQELADFIFLQFLDHGRGARHPCLVDFFDFIKAHVLGVLVAHGLQQ